MFQDEEQEQKKGALGDIMSFLDEIMLGKMKSKKEPQMVPGEQVAELPADPAAELAAMQEMPVDPADPEAALAAMQQMPTEEVPVEDSIPPELLAKLEEMYGK